MKTETSQNHLTQKQEVEQTLAAAMEYHQVGQLQQAEFLYRKILSLQPNHADALHLLGVLAHQAGNRELAIQYIRKAIKLTPDYFLFHYNLANALLDSGKLPEAILAYKNALRLNPDYTESWNNLGLAQKYMGLYEEAAACYKRMLQIAPGSSEALVNLGSVLKDLKLFDDALACFQQAIAISPNLLQAHINQGNVFRDQGKRDKALVSYQQALALDPDSAIAIRTVTTLHVILPSAAAISQTREDFYKQIEILSRKKLTGHDPFSDIAATNFYLAYHGLNDRTLQKSFADFCLKIYPSLAWTAPHCRNTTSHQNGKRIRLGFFSAFFYSHVIGQLNQGIIKNLNRTLFEVILFRPFGKEDNCARQINQAADQVCYLPNSLVEAREIISLKKLDILFYPEIGMDPFTFYLAFSRLAPVQCVTWGHPDTTGIPNIDYYISSELIETQDAASHYTEHLVLLKNLPTFYAPPPLPLASIDRKKYGLPDDYNLYICPQSLFKFHPDFDAYLGLLLRRDPRGLLVLIEGNNPHWTKLLKQRFHESFPDVAARIQFLPRMDTEKFLGLMLLADALLDPPYFGGGNTSFEAFSLGIPIVTWPSLFMRGRVTCGCYKRMGILDLVADSAEKYIELALRLAHDQIWKQELSQKILDRSHLLFEDWEVIRELESFFKEVVIQKENGMKS